MKAAVERRLTALELARAAQEPPSDKLTPAEWLAERRMTPEQKVALRRGPRGYAWRTHDAVAGPRLAKALETLADFGERLEIDG